MVEEVQKDISIVKIDKDNIFDYCDEFPNKFNDDFAKNNLFVVKAFSLLTKKETQFFVNGNDIKKWQQEKEKKDK
jgi:hypothetical protein